MTFWIFESRPVDERTTDHPPVAVYIVEVAIDPPNRQSVGLLEWLNQFFQVRWVPDIVLVKQRDQCACRMSDSEVAGGRLAPVRLVQQRDDRMFLREPFDDGRSHPAIRRTVVDHNEFIRCECLRKHALDGLLDPPSSVVEWNDRDNRKITMRLCHPTCPQSTRIHARG